MPVFEQTLPAQSAGGAVATAEVCTVELTDDSGLGISRVELTPPPGFTTVTGQATNNVTFTVRQLRAGTPVGTVGTVTLNAGTNLAAEVPLNVPVVSPTPSVAPDDVIDVQMTQNGTGLAVGAGIVVTVDVS